MKRAHLMISGQVQGVFFRARTKTMADSLGLTGWVRNLRDGSVEAVFEGGDAAVEQAVEWCRKGPSRAIVTAVTRIEEPYTGTFKTFQVTY